MKSVVSIADELSCSARNPVAKRSDVKSKLKPTYVRGTLRRIHHFDGVGESGLLRVSKAALVAYTAEPTNSHPHNPRPQENWSNRNGQNPRQATAKIPSNTCPLRRCPRRICPVPGMIADSKAATIRRFVGDGDRGGGVGSPVGNEMGADSDTG